MLAEVMAHRDDVEAVSYHRDCGECPGGDACRRPEVTDTLGHRWPRCPMALLRSPAVAAVVDTFNASKLSPLAGWPDDYAAFVVEGVIAIESAQARKVADETRAGSPRQSPRQFWRAAGVT